jgi:hypothetical protein
MLENKAFTEFLLAFGLLLPGILTVYFLNGVDFNSYAFVMYFVVFGISLVYGVSSVVEGTKQLFKKNAKKAYSMLAILGGILIIGFYATALYGMTLM